MTSYGFSCIVPFYNEGPKFLGVLATLDQIPEIQQLICVDDGSVSNTAALIAQRFPGVQIVCLPRNEGKAAAVRRGLAVAQEGNILLMDADLGRLQVKEIEGALRKFQEGFWDCLILQNQGDNALMDHLLRKDIVFSGQRIMKKANLLKVFEEKKPRGFQLELATNLWLMSNCKKVAWLRGSSYNPHKVRKMGFWRGLFLDLRNDLNLMAYAGLVNYYKQLFLFCRWKIKA